MNKFYKIGEILENGQIEKGASAQGMIYKNLEAFVNKTGVCYVPELDDTEYTYMDFYNLVNGNEELARVLFDMVDWQSPETKLDELVQNDEINFCANCENAYDSYEVDKCPHCGQLKVIDYSKGDEFDTYNFSVNNKDYKVEVNKKLMDKMNWSWDSLIFADNIDTFATVIDDTNKESSVLNTNGDVKVLDLINDIELSKEEIIKLALLGEINNSNRYSIDANNWFGVDYIKDSYLIEDIVFEAIANTTLGVANEMMEFHLNFFDNK